MDFKNAYIKTPSYIINLQKLKQNLLIIKEIREKSGAKILLAQKAFSCYELYPLISKYCDGTTASGLFEAKLSNEFFTGENHCYSPSYNKEHFREILDICSHIVVNSKSEYDLYQSRVINAGKKLLLRINPEISTQSKAIYDPCSVGSRFGVKIADFSPLKFRNITGFHFHTLCEQGFFDLKKTADKFFSLFGGYIKEMGIKELNFGGGHHLTNNDYNRTLLIDYIKDIRAKYNVEVYLEPGEAFAINAGYLAAKVLDIIENSGIDNVKIAILDASAACHAPDVIEMPYTPPIDFPEIGENENYILAGNTCLAGDIFGNYSFKKPLSKGDLIIFSDMAIYSMVKNNTFNGTPLPSILFWDEDKEQKLITYKTFGYNDFKTRI